MSKFAASSVVGYVELKSDFRSAPELGVEDVELVSEGVDAVDSMSVSC
eukprot:CAMPEP_0197248444 /NCGR_PEP_ID=MMETSP1429-20130617/39109_1 /TAXON_ID=49237 /ORGANISM="Chaetoceros  sp., Strain UNC1202" /LENGTH=47 /DNA_ID= /DNA_START= /DNA_END= /DNA_ORIENTATION=